MNIEKLGQQPNDKFLFFAMLNVDVRNVDVCNVDIRNIDVWNIYVCNVDVCNVDVCNVVFAMLIDSGAKLALQILYIY
jgi:hypothetical protein